MSDIGLTGAKTLGLKSGDELSLSVSAASHPGKVRDANEDSFSLNGVSYRAESGLLCIEQELKEPALFCVCDGMGGEMGGGTASDIAIKETAQLYSSLISGEADIFGAVDGYINRSNEKICRALKNSMSHRGGTTAAIAYIANGTLYAFSVGDSRIYIKSGGGLKLVSVDHTLAMKKLRAGIYSCEQAEASSDRHVLTLFLGADTDGRGLRAESYGPYELNPEDAVLICTDGLYDMCTEAEISGVLSAGGPVSKKLINQSLAAGGADNATCIAVRVGKRLKTAF